MPSSQTPSLPGLSLGGCVTAGFTEIELAQEARSPHLPSLSRVTYFAVINEDHMESFPSPAI